DLGGASSQSCERLQSRGGQSNTAHRPRNPMKTSHASLARGTPRFIVATLSSALFVFAGATVLAAPAEKAPSASAVSNQAAKLPLESAFAKQTAGENKG